MELPIFRELESAWFRVGTTESRAVPYPDSTAGYTNTTGYINTAGNGIGYAGSASGYPGGASDSEYASSGYAGEAGSRGRDSSSAGLDGDDAAMAAATSGAGRPGTHASAGGAGGRGDEVSWRTAADDGWLAAQAAAAPPEGGTTERGLPRRVPMAQLVPGGVDQTENASARRTPDAVRGLLSAYHRGVQRGRTAQGNTAEPTATGSQPARGTGPSSGHDSGKEHEA